MESLQCNVMAVGLQKMIGNGRHNTMHYTQALTMAAVIQSHEEAFQASVCFIPRSRPA